jgi:hypothetical protein
MTIKNGMDLMLYELATLSFHPLYASKASAGARAYIGDAKAKGEFLGSWMTDIGTIGRLLIFARLPRSR